MGVYDMLRCHAPPILILLHLHLVCNVSLKGDQAMSLLDLQTHMPLSGSISEFTTLISISTHAAGL